MISSKKESLFSFLFVLAGVCLLYGQTLGFGFVWDDHIEVAGNDVFHQASNLWKFFTVPYWNLLTGGFAPYHRPMIPVMILGVSTFFGKNPFGYHLLNLGLFTLTAWVFYLTLRQMPVKRWTAIAATALFLVHPVHAEPVSWGSARPVLLSGLCFITCLYFSFRAATVEKKKRVFYFSLLFFFFSVGLLSYHSILTLAPLVFLSDFFDPAEKKKSWHHRAVECTGYAILGLSFITFCLYLFERMGETDLTPFYNGATANLVYTGVPLENLQAFFNTLSRYAEILLFPMNLVPDPAFKSSAYSLSALGALLLLALFTFLIGKSSSLRKQIYFSALWMFCGLLTVANLFPTGGLFADRYAYIASMGFALWLALAMDSLHENFPFIHQKLVSLLLACIVMFWSMKTMTYSQTWKNDFSFWLEASILAPGKPRTHDKLGIILAANGHLEEAVKEYQKVIELNPDQFLMTYQRLADVLKKLGRDEEASAAQKQFEDRMKKAREQYAPGRKNILLALSN